MKPKSYRKKATRQPAVRKRQLELLSRANEVVEQLRNELPQLLAVAVVDVASGTSLAAHTSSPTLDLLTAAKFQAGLVQRKHEALAALNLPDEQLEDIMITLSSQLHLLRLSSTGERLISLVVDAQTTNLALARDILRTRAEQLDAASALRAA
ncbi:hypothetical protein [Hymenobacter swuensis]|uniref:Roadblock/LAMTOR2 domain-containing protein n=1 Tax=Hymenobacter swuensis DY53 TaxID=1227739 RepID=W8FCS4_9BACT|nr:hypothetical protein [Hymenobacter swuensis]AHJ99470.1 hypothetical protein Hsw_3875 [Hymenobacter swuensis DY53]